MWPATRLLATLRANAMNEIPSRSWAYDSVSRWCAHSRNVCLWMYFWHAFYNDTYIYKNVRMCRSSFFILIYTIPHVFDLFAIRMPADMISFIIFFYRVFTIGVLRVRKTWRGAFWNRGKICARHSNRTTNDRLSIILFER